MLEPRPRPPFGSRTPPIYVPPKQLARVHAFVDESGDRNTTLTRQSDFFTMTAVLVAEEYQSDLRVAIAGLRSVFNAPGAFHWKEQCGPKSIGRRNLVVRTLARLPGIQTVHVVLDKTRLKPASYIHGDQEVAYHWVSKFLVERIAWAAQNWEGRPRSAVVRLGTVGGVDHDATLEVLQRVERASGRKSAHPMQRAIPWENIVRPPQWSSAADWDGLQAADAYSGILTAAVKDDQGAWLAATRHQLFRMAGRIEGWGVKTLPDWGHLQNRNWWSELQN